MNGCEPVATTTIERDLDGMKVSYYGPGEEEFDMVATKGVEKITIAVTPEMASMVRAAVEGGGYASTSEVFREALRLWQAHQAARDHEVEELRRLWQEGLDSGPSRDGAEVFARLRQRYGAGA
jgi:antitoxin ParD1/3/4